MLTPNQERYLLTIPEDKVISVKLFDPKVQDTANEIIYNIKEILPEAEILFLGASALGIAGQNDIDMTILANGKFEEFSKVLKQLFGEPKKPNPALIKWEFIQNGFEVELYLNDKMSPNLQEQIDTFNILKNSPELRNEYEKIEQKSR